MKKYDVEITVLGISDDKLDDELSAIEAFIRERGFDVRVGIGQESDSPGVD